MMKNNKIKKTLFPIFQMIYQLITIQVGANTENYLQKDSDLLAALNFKKDTLAITIQNQASSKISVLMIKL